MICEKCKIDHYGLYGSGRFCSSKCAKSFATMTNREEISKKVSIALKGVPKPYSKNLLGNKNGMYGKKHKVESIAKMVQKKMDKRESRTKDWANGNINIPKYIAREYLMEKYDNKCQECGWSKVNEKHGRVPLEVHHIDGNSNNNFIDNLKILCPNCHSLTPTYMALNKINKSGIGV